MVFGSSIYYPFTCGVRDGVGEPASVFGRRTQESFRPVSAGSGLNQWVGKPCPATAIQSVRGIITIAD